MKVYIAALFDATLPKPGDVVNAVRELKDDRKDP